MLIKLLLSPIFAFISFIVSLIPAIPHQSGSIASNFYEFVGFGLYFFGSAPFTMTIGCVIAWSALQFTWALIEWSYKKIPGIS